MHIDVVRQRLRDRWRIGQIGSRIRTRLGSAIRRSGFVQDGEFLHAHEGPPVRVRTPTEDCDRSVKQIHGSELALAVANMVPDAGTITAEHATTHVARLYGWARGGADIRSTLGATVEALLTDGRLIRVGGELSVPS